MVYAKPPFAGPEHVLDYVGRYTHRIAIANHRILDVRDGRVRFAYRVVTRLLDDMACFSFDRDFKQLGLTVLS